MEHHERVSYMELTRELEAACRLLSAAVPLALDVLKSGHASLADQEDFWTSMQSFEQFVEVLNEERNALSPDGLPGLAEELAANRREMALEEELASAH